MRLRFWRAERGLRLTRGPVYFRPTVEGMEDRVVLSATSAAPSLVGAVSNLAQRAGPILPITVNSVTATGGQLLANASIGGTNFQIPLSLTVPPGQSALSTTQILNLHLAPIHLDLLGLKVDTSEICLNISAQSGPGNLLGNLLSNVAGLLDNGVNLGTILGGLSATDLSTLTTGLTGLLDGALGALTSPMNAVGGASVSSAGTTNILHLALGPVNLNLLGLEVNLDNCAGGPITVDITAQSGPGQLLGNLLGGLAHLLDSNAATTALLNKLSNIAGEIAALV